MQNNTRTSDKPTFQYGEDASMSFPEDFHANRSASQDSDEGRKTTAISGRKCCAQFEKFIPAMSWVRMFSESLIGRTDWFSSKCVLTWKLKVTKYNRVYFQLAVSMRRTNDTVHGSSPMLLKTPSAVDAYADRLSKKEQRFGNSGSLAQEVATGFIYQRGLLPTVQTQGLKIYRNGRSEPLPTKLLPTPETNDGRSDMPNRIETDHMQRLNDTTAYRAGATSRLNPLFVEEMMGFPTGWILLPFLKDCPNDNPDVGIPS